MLLRFASAICVTAISLSAIAHEHGDAPAAHDNGLNITQAWSRAMPPSAPTGAVYFVLRNPGETDDRLVGAQTPQAGKAELHTHVHKGEMMSMQQVESVAVPAAAQVEFKPGGHHVMMFDMTKPLVAGEQFPLTLRFEKAGEITVEVDVRDDAPASSMAGEHGHH